MRETKTIYDDILEVRCGLCQYARYTITAARDNLLLGCYHEPYTGKCVTEIERCPIGTMNMRLEYDE